jgi:signal transduction histidine kinase/ActR/RegA family two-component response regulator
MKVAGATFSALLIIAAGAASAAPGSGREITVLDLAAAIERRADATSFEALEAFGAAALETPGEEGLRRLHHVAWVFLNQSEFERFQLWNRRLSERAKAVGSRRFSVVAELNDWQAAYDRGETARSSSAVARIARSSKDWFVKAHAMRLRALHLLDDGKPGVALQVLGDAVALVPAHDPAAGSAKSGVLEIKGLVLRELQDVRHATMAFWESEFVYADPSYPRPDFDNLYNLASIAVRTGDQRSAEALYAAHHRLARQSDLPGLDVWDADLCAAVAEGRGDPRGVLNCLAPLATRRDALGDAASHLLPMRAMAFARLGRVVEARRDLAELREMKSPAVPRVEIELLRAEGRAAEAYDRYAAYVHGAMSRVAERHSADLSAVTEQLEQELELRRQRLETLERNTALQRLLLALSVAFLGGLAVVSIWQARVASKLRHARAAAESANKAKSDFLANMSHEIRTPLNGVVGMADLLAGAELEPREREIAIVIRDSGRTLERLLSEVLDLARIESGQVTIQPEPFHLGEAVRSVAALWRLKAEEKGVVLRVLVDEAVDHNVVGDPLRVRQILTNLVSNAVKFTDHGEVTVAAEPARGGVRLAVRDTGVGFERSHKQLVFSRFQQADGSITRRYGGSGLGLSISHQLAELMGGTLDCESTPGAGSCFWADLPLPSAEALEERRDAVDAPPRAAPSGGRILLVDDNPTNLKVIEIMLAGAGVEIVTASNGAEALQAWELQDFDAILMDMQMPVMDGLTALRAIRRRELETGRVRASVLMLTANALPEHIEAGRSAGADGHVSKPVSPAALYEALATSSAEGKAAAAA